MLIYGINPVMEALRAGRVRAVRLRRAAGGRLGELRQLAIERRVPVVDAQPSELDRTARGGLHQGVVAELEASDSYTPLELARGAKAAPLLVVLDGIEDPHNLGAILRSVDAAGADGVVRQTRHAAPLDGAAAKASSGAIAWVRIAEVVNVTRAVDELKEGGVWTIGLDADAPVTYDAVDYTLPSAIVLGAEGQGLRRLVREHCDHLVSIPMSGHVASLNVSAAAAVVLFEAARQRRARGGT
jgi:23S rRNA (guanosine2251-2'-O)-methyltransferase